MDGTKESVDVLAVDVIEPAGAVDVKIKEGISQSEMEAYARRTGKPFIRIKDLQQRAILGELQERLGGSRIGSAMLLDSEDKIEAGIKLCDEFIALYRELPEIVAGLIKVRLGFVDSYVRVAHTHIKSKKDSGPDMSNQPPQNIPFPASVPVQVNVQTNISQSQPDKANVQE
jgi:hypothetical protein